MVAWRVLPRDEVQVTFDAEDDDAWRLFCSRGYGVAARKAQVSEAHAMAAEKRKRHLTLPETYFAAAVDGVLPTEESLHNLWKRFRSCSATFERNFVVYQHFRRLGWTPKPGLNYGAQYVLYRGSAAEFHSEYVVYVQDNGAASSWNTIQSLTRIAADVKKTVLLCTVTVDQASTTSSGASDAGANAVCTSISDLTFGEYIFHGVQYSMEAIAIRFWDASIADAAESYTFQPQPVLLKKAKAAKKKNRVKRPKRQQEGDVLPGTENKPT